jgi:adenosine deaminase
MKRTQLSFLIVFALLLMTPSAAQSRASRPSAEARTAGYLDAIRARPAKLRAFLRAMPKGADLHNHLSGAVPTETLIGYAVSDRLCIDTTTFTATPAPAVTGDPCPAGQRPAADSKTDRAFFAQIVRAWSMQGFQPGAQTSHDHFFATFGKFGLATSRKGDMLAKVANINARQHVLYLETLVSRQSDAVRALADKVGFDPSFAALRRKLLDGGLPAIVAAASADTDADLTRYKQLLRCGTRHADPGCAMVIRYDYQVSRATKPEIVFTNLLLGFELQRRDPRYVGVNLVQPEDDPVALRDYTLQMRMIRYLRTVYRSAHVTLHAGEIVSGLVPAADLRSHIRQAVEIAGAERIGHGVDVAGETSGGQLLAEMARRHVLVEVPLTSNAQILGVFGAAHPFVNYRAAGVPVALATDDAGVERIDLTHEYQLATTQYRLDYGDLKTLSRASLEHAFLPGASLWRSRDHYRLARACSADRPGERRPGRACRSLLRHSAKALTEWKLERAFRSFERHWRCCQGRARRAKAADLRQRIDARRDGVMATQPLTRPAWLARVTADRLPAVTGHVSASS